MTNEKPVPLVSVCIPTFNMGRFLGEAIKSVLAQTFRDFEVVICDNCSTDETAAVVGKFEDPRIHYFLNECNLGMYRNFNRTIEHARGEFVKFLCADDRLERRYLEKAVNLFDRFPRVGIVTALHRWVDGRGCEVSRHAPRRLRGPVVISGQEMLRRAPWRHNEMGTPSHVVVRREAFERLGGFDLAYTYVNDWEMWLRIFTQYDVGFLRGYLVVIRAHPEQASSHKETMLINARDTIRLAQTHYESDWWKRQLLMARSGEIYFWAAVRRFLFGEPSEAWQLLRLVSQNACRTLLFAYILLHFPFWCWRGVRRQYSQITGTVWET